MSGRSSRTRGAACLLPASAQTRQQVLSCVLSCSPQATPNSRRADRCSAPPSATVGVAVAQNNSIPHVFGPSRRHACRWLLHGRQLARCRRMALEVSAGDRALLRYAARAVSYTSPTHRRCRGGGRGRAHQHQMRGGSVARSQLRCLPTASTNDGTSRVSAQSARLSMGRPADSTTLSPAPTIKIGLQWRY